MPPDGVRVHVVPTFESEQLKGKPEWASVAMMDVKTNASQTRLSSTSSFFPFPDIPL
jgi:hypothetical protein